MKYWVYLFISFLLVLTVSSSYGTIPRYGTLHQYKFNTFEWSNQAVETGKFMINLDFFKNNIDAEFIFKNIIYHSYQGSPLMWEFKLDTTNYPILLIDDFYFNYDRLINKSTSTSLVFKNILLQFDYEDLLDFTIIYNVQIYRNSILYQTFNQKIIISVDLREESSSEELVTYFLLILGFLFLIPIKNYQVSGITYKERIETYKFLIWRAHVLSTMIWLSFDRIFLKEHLVIAKEAVLITLFFGLVGPLIIDKYFRSWKNPYSENELEVIKQTYPGIFDITDDPRFAIVNRIDKYLAYTLMQLILIFIIGIFKVIFEWYNFGIVFGSIYLIWIAKRE